MFANDLIHWISTTSHLSYFTLNKVESIPNISNKNNNLIYFFE